MAYAPPARHLLRARDLVDARYFEPIGVDDLARAAGLSRFHFSREFRKAFGESPHAYLLTRRLERAAALLRGTDRRVAEICFAAQVALCLRQVGMSAHVPWIVTTSYFVVPPLVLAQCFCWYSVITLNHLGHAIEESLWTMTMALVGVCSAVAARHLEGNMFWCAAGGAVLALGFVAFMTLVDVPMYLRRWRQARDEEQAFLSVRAGVRDALNRRIATKEWSVWRPEVAWLTGYFSVAVWLSVSFVHFSRQ